MFTMTRAYRKTIPSRSRNAVKLEPFPALFRHDLWSFQFYGCCASNKVADIMRLALLRAGKGPLCDNTNRLNQGGRHDYEKTTLLSRGRGSTFLISLRLCSGRKRPRWPPLRNLFLLPRCRYVLLSEQSQLLLAGTGRLAAWRSATAGIL